MDYEFLPILKNQDVIYFIRAENDKIKIGKTKNLRRRLTKMQCDCPLKLTILLVLPKTDLCEKIIHNRFEKHLSHGEWFSPHEEILDFIKAEKGMAFGQKKEEIRPNETPLGKWLKTNDLSASYLAKQTEVSAGTIYRIINEEKAKYHPRILDRIKNITAIDIELLMSEEANKRPEKRGRKKSQRKQVQDGEQ